MTRHGRLLPKHLYTFAARLVASRFLAVTLLRRIMTALRKARGLYESQRQISKDGTFPPVRLHRAAGTFYSKAFIFLVEVKDRYEAGQSNLRHPCSPKNGLELSLPPLPSNLPPLPSKSHSRQLCFRKARRCIAIELSQSKPSGPEYSPIVIDHLNPQFLECRTGDAGKYNHRPKAKPPFRSALHPA
jgi:hypothetical protein